MFPQISQQLFKIDLRTLYTVLTLQRPGFFRPTKSGGGRIPPPRLKIETIYGRGLKFYTHIKINKLYKLANFQTMATFCSRDNAYCFLKQWETMEITEIF